MSIAFRGLGLVSCLGPDLDAAVAAVAAGRMPEPAWRRIDGVERPYRAIARAGDDAWTRNLDLSRAAAEQALAGLSWSERAETAVFVGSSSYTVNAIEQAWPAYGPAAGSFGGMAEVLRRELGLVGPALGLSSACTSGLSALAAAQQALSLGRLRRVLVLGLEFENRLSLAGFAALGLLSTTACRPLDPARDGLVLGEAAAALLVEAAEDGTGERLLSLVQRTDSHSATGLNPDGAPVAQAIGQALAAAGLPAEALDLVKLQAAGSPANDVIEARALSRVFAAPPRLLSLKPWLGHCLGASGPAELALLLGCWRAGFTPGTGCELDRDPELGLELPAGNAPAIPRHALFQILGFGGSLACAVLASGRPE
ncbi:MAG: beta-ketoacyl synthase [Gammaproteobacteria bacterium]|nr:beta-ketoacyl synthase [Gammaproteobacteria bacterium]